MSFSISPRIFPFFDSGEDVVLPDFPVRDRLDLFKSKLQPGDVASYKEAVDAIDFEFDASIDAFLDFIRKVLNPFLVEVLPDKDLPMIKLRLYLSFVGPKRFMRVDCAYERLRQEMYVEFKNVSFDDWLAQGFELIDDIHLPEDIVLEELIHVLIGKPEDDWTRKMDFILSHASSATATKLFLGFIQLIASTRKIEWTQTRRECLCRILENPEISFEDCIYFLEHIPDLTIEKTIMGKILTREAIDSEIYLFLMIDLLPLLKDKQSLVGLSQRAVICDDEAVHESAEFVDLRLCLTDAAIESFKAFFALAEEPVRIKAYRNLMTCVHFYWKMNLDEYCSRAANLLDQIAKLNLNGTFDYLDFRQKVTFLILIETIQNFVEDRASPNITLPGDMGRTFCINETWINAAIYFFTYQRNDPSSSESAVAFVLDKLLPESADSQFVFLSALKNEMNHRLFLKDQSPEFMAALHVVLFRYAQHPQVEERKELLQPFLNELEVAFRLRQFTFKQAFWIAELLKGKNRPLSRADAKNLVEAFFEEKGLGARDFFKNFVAMYRILISTNGDSLDSDQLHKVENFASLFLSVRNQVQETLKIQDQIKERLSVVLKIFELLEIDEEFLIEVYKKLINCINDALVNNFEIDEKFIKLKNNKIERSRKLHENRKEKKSKERSVLEDGPILTQGKLIKVSFKTNLLRVSKKPEKTVSSLLIKTTLESFSFPLIYELHRALENLKKDLSELEKRIRI